MSDASSIEVQVTDVRRIARDTAIYDLHAIDGECLPAAEAGAHIDLHLPNGLVRQYSLCALGLRPSKYTICVKKDPNSRGGSTWMVNTVAPGQRLVISRPRNNFRLREDAAETVLIAGGIGITPIRAMALRLAEMGKAWKMFYCAQTRSEAAFYEELVASPNVEIHLDDERGHLFNLQRAIDMASLDGAHLYCCGPVSMLNAFKQLTSTFPSDRVHVEFFSAPRETAPRGGFDVELAQRGLTLHVPIGSSILEVLLAQGLDVPSSCQQGICGSCETVVLGGEPDHRDQILSDAERLDGKTMMICCSGAKTEKLVLDL